MHFEKHLVASYKLCLFCGYPPAPNWLKAEVIILTKLNDYSIRVNTACDFLQNSLFTILYILCTQLGINGIVYYGDRYSTIEHWNTLKWIGYNLNTLIEQLKRNT